MGRILAGIFISVRLARFIYPLFAERRDGAGLLDKHPPHILVVSVCSLRPDRLSPYNPAFTFSPHIGKWAKDAFIFDNAIAEKPWQNFFFDSNEIIKKELVNAHGYTGFRK